MTQSLFTNYHLPIIVGTRGSALAQWQTNFIIAALKRLAPTCTIETRLIKTEGDQDQVRPLAELGGLGVFTKAIEDALLAREIDLAVHSLKDLPTELAPGLKIAAIPERADPRDCIVSRHGVGLMQLPRGARVGTSSARRTAQVLALRPDIQVVPLRGNVDTRLRKAQSKDYDAVVLAAAGITRLGRAAEITEYLPLDQFLPDPGQGALAVEIRADDTELAALVERLDHPQTRAAVTAERAFLGGLGGGCRMPIGAYGEIRGDELHLHGMVASDDGKQIAREQLAGRAAQAEELGARLAQKCSATGFSGPLDGKRIVITRAREQASALADKVRALGGIPIECPTIEFAPVEDTTELDDALTHANTFDWVVFTSANGVRAVTARLRSLRRDPQSLASSKIAAIGPATAQALQEIGVRVDFVPTKYRGEQIALELPIERGQSALLLRADIASDVLARGLTARGVNVKNIDAYRTLKPSIPPIDWTQIDAITFTSSSTVRNLTEMLDGQRANLDQVAVFCIGPVTAETARELGWRTDAVASEHTMDGLIAVMTEYYRTRN